MLVVQICVGSSCHIRGSAFIINALQEKLKARNLADQVELKAQFCMGDCLNGVCMTIDGEKVRNVSPGNIDQVIEEQIVGRIK